MFPKVLWNIWHDKKGGGGWWLTSSTNKVEEPLSGGANGHVHGTQSGSGYLADQNPADGAPAELERRSP